MTIIDAIKHGGGKRIRRTHWPSGEWISPQPQEVIELSGTDIIANDWQIEEKAVLVTRSQLLTALENAAKRFGGSAGTLAQGVYLRGSREILQEVGLGE